MIEHTFEQNKVYANQETYDALIEHFNKIDNLARNKKFEWEDEKNPKETFCVTADFNEWFGFVVTDLKGYYLHFNYEVPADLENSILRYTEQLKPYINGFMLQPFGVVEGNLLREKVIYKDTFEEIVEFAKELKQNNRVFLYQVFHKPEVADGNRLYYEEILGNYALRYAVIEND